MDRPAFTHNPFSPELGPSTARVSSPLNPSASGQPSDSLRPRLHSMSTMMPPPSQPSASALSAALLSDSRSSTFLQRTRSRSATPVEESIWKKTLGSPSPSAEHWWNGAESRIRSWSSPDASRHTASIESKEGWQTTKERVIRAAHSALGTTIEVGHEVLELSTELLEYAPIPGLQSAARTLLQIWDALQLVDMNRSACLRLTERCADILLSVRQEVQDAGDQVGEELTQPIATLTKAFDTVRLFLIRDVARPFLKRYLRREESQREIAGCNNLLHEALTLFSVSIQVRILKQVQAADNRRQQDTDLILDAIRRSSVVPYLEGNALGLHGIHEEYRSSPTIPRNEQGMPPSSSHASLAATSPLIPLDYRSPTLLPGRGIAQPQSSASSLTITQGPPVTPSRVVPTLTELIAEQNEHDYASDRADLRNVLRNVLSTGTDADIISILGIKREEMPEAIKTLQRHIERIMDRQGASIPQAALVPESEPVVVEQVPISTKNKDKESRNKITTMVRRISVTSSKDLAVGGKLGRSKTVATMASTSSEDSADAPATSTPEVDTLDREFIETTIDALRRLSRGADLNLPSWTITRFEVDREKKIGFGYFSDVYKGTWRGRTVAIKVLAETTPRNLFVREVGIWKTLNHPNVLDLYGASSATGDPPWFFVSPYEQNGTLAEYLRQIDGGRIRTSSLPEFRYSMSNISAMARTREDLLSLPSAQGRMRSGSGGIEAAEYDTKGLDLLKFMYEIAKGMQYLHSKGVLHGDLKASNVLIDDEFRCRITDFGQSEMKSEAFRLSGAPAPQEGALRWQAPEIMMGLSDLTPQADIFSFALTCIEILTMGRPPWGLAQEDTIRHLVLKEDSRPLIPITPYTRPGEPAVLQELIRTCWHRNPKVRPEFTTVLKEIKTMRLGEGVPEEILSPKIPDWTPLPQSEDWDRRGTASPDLHPTGLISSSPPRQFVLGNAAESALMESTSFHREAATFTSPVPPRLTTGASTVRMSMPEPMLYAPSSAQVTRAPSAATSSTQSEEDSLLNLVESDDYESPPVLTKNIADMRDERRYRLLLSHKFHPSLTLPLWSPLPVHLGAVGYLQKPDGAFVTLFNAIMPSKSPDGQHPHTLPSVHGYGNVSAQSTRYDQRNAAQRGFDAITGIFRRPDGPAARYIHPLRAGHKTAFMYTESCSYKYLEDLEAPKRWFKANIDEVLAIYGSNHPITREDVFLVIGTLSAADYALFVSHNHPDGHARFNVLPPKSKQPWGVIKTDTEIVGGPSYHEPIPGGSVSNSKISKNGGTSVTLLLARLRFKPDAIEPTSL